MNAELEATIGPILNVYSGRHGVILSACDGDKPGLQLDLYRWVKGLGLEPRVTGNVKGLQDPYRDPTTQKEFAEKWWPDPVHWSTRNGSRGIVVGGTVVEPSRGGSP
jgi:predicted homoserine dehydrogenase-like protein